MAFDVNEALLDLQTMEPTFERIFADKRAIRPWFANLIIYSAALTVAGCYVPFTDIGSAVMKMLAAFRARLNMDVLIQERALLAVALFVSSAPRATYILMSQLQARGSKGV